MLNIAEQLDDVPLTHFFVDSYKIGRHALERVLICLMHESSGFSKVQLLWLEERIKDYQLEEFQSDFAGEQWKFADMLQRCFVVTESGDGYIHMPTFYDYTDHNRLKGWDYLCAPWAAKKNWYSLLQLKQQHARLMQIAKRDFSQPAWQLGRSKLNVAITELAEDEKSTILLDLLPHFATSYIAAEIAFETADVVLIIIAARRFALEHGKWPKALRDLVPQYLEQIPRNRFDGKQYGSKLKDGLLTVYSFGFDGDDDQGRRSLPVEPDDESDEPEDVLSLKYRLDRKRYRAERRGIADDWWNRINGLTVEREDGDIVHFEELPAMPDGSYLPLTIE